MGFRVCRAALKTMGLPNIGGLGFRWGLKFRVYQLELYLRYNIPKLYQESSTTSFVLG